jgi:hypothetical protein
VNEWIAWAAFAGAWLLVAGPLYQGSVELHELDIDRESIEGFKTSYLQKARQDLPSAWWWLVPPVMYVKRRRWNKDFWQTTYAQLNEIQRDQLKSFRNKASGWFTVAIGATLLAVGETWQVIKHYGWPMWLFWLLVVVMLAVSILNTAVRMISDQRQPVSRPA